MKAHCSFPSNSKKSQAELTQLASEQIAKNALGTATADMPMQLLHCLASSQPISVAAKPHLPPE
jgi:hypothetical protein